MGSTKENDLGGLGDFGAYDDVDIFGLDSFGDPTGMAALYGAMIGTGVGTLTAIGIRSLKPDWKQWSELVGLAGGVLVGGGLMVSSKTRHAGWVAIASSALNNGLRAIEQYFRPAPFNMKGFGEQRVQRVGAFAGGGMGIQQVQQVNGGGLGQPQLMQGTRKMASLMGRQFNKAASHWGTSPVLMNQ